MELTDDLKAILMETATKLKGADRHRFLAQTVNALGHGGQNGNWAGTACHSRDCFGSWPLLVK